MKRNTFPNSCLEFTNKEFHVLRPHNPKGIVECLQVLELEFNPIFYDSKSESDPELLRITKEGPVELKRYSSFTIGEQVFTEFGIEAVRAFIKNPFVLGRAR